MWHLAFCIFQAWLFGACSHFRLDLSSPAGASNFPHVYCFAAGFAAVCTNATAPSKRDFPLEPRMDCHLARNERISERVISWKCLEMLQLRDCDLSCDHIQKLGGPSRAKYGRLVKFHMQRDGSWSSRGQWRCLGYLPKLDLSRFLPRQDETPHSAPGRYRYSA